MTVTTTGGMCSSSRKRWAAKCNGNDDYLAQRIRAGRFLKRDMAEAMGLPESMTSAEIGEAVPPAYAKFLGEQALAYLD